MLAGFKPDSILAFNLIEVGGHHSYCFRRYVLCWLDLNKVQPSPYTICILKAFNHSVLCYHIWICIYFGNALVETIGLTWTNSGVPLDGISALTLVLPLSLSASF